MSAPAQPPVVPEAVRALAEAASRGVRVRLLLQGRIEYRLPHFGTLALHEELLRAGVEIIEYQPGFLHAKLALADQWFTIGSSNIDPFSLLLAREANVVVDDRGFAGQLRTSLLAAIQERARQVHPARWRSRPPWERLPVWMAYALVRTLMGKFGYGGQH